MHVDRIFHTFHVHENRNGKWRRKELQQPRSATFQAVLCRYLVKDDIMNMSRKWVRVGLGALILASASATWQLTRAQQPQMPNARPKQDTGVLMLAKLGSSQKVVEGLMSGDFATIKKGANDLLQVCDSQNWRQYEDQIVTHYRAELGRDARKMIAQAEDKNLEGAAYVYMHALTTCINCHEYSRNVLRIAGDASHNMVVPIPVTEQEAHVVNRNSVIR